jgi:hypothetical protein
MPDAIYRNRRAARIENDLVRVTVLVAGGHIAEILHKPTGVNPLWTPPWPSIEPSAWSRAGHPEYGDDAESKLLAGIMGHNLCLDIFGAPSAEEAAAGLTVHGEASVAPWDVRTAGSVLHARATLPNAQLRVERQIELAPEGVVQFSEAVENLAATDRPIAWTEHVTLGPPFLAKGSTQFRVSATRGKVADKEPAAGGYLKPGAEFEWPNAPAGDGSVVDLRVYTARPASSAFTTQLMDPAREQAFFAAWSPESHVAFGYVWRPEDFPWLGIWEENYSRTTPPWNGKTLTRGMEFGASPLPEPRRAQIERHRMFGVPCYRWIPAKTRVEVRYHAFIRTLDTVPEQGI